jgi:hypothetical protein
MEIPQRIRMRGHKLRNARKLKSSTLKLSSINRIPIVIRMIAQKT